MLRLIANRAVTNTLLAVICVLLYLVLTKLDAIDRQTAALTYGKIDVKWPENGVVVRAPFGGAVDVKPR